MRSDRSGPRPGRTDARHHDSRPQRTWEGDRAEKEDGSDSRSDETAWQSPCGCSDLAAVATTEEAPPQTPTIQAHTGLLVCGSLVIEILATDTV